MKIRRHNKRKATDGRHRKGTQTVFLVAKNEYIFFPVEHLVTSQKPSEVPHGHLGSQERMCFIQEITLLVLQPWRRAELKQEAPSNQCVFPATPSPHSHKSTLPVVFSLSLDPKLKTTYCSLIWNINLSLILFIQKRKSVVGFKATPSS